MKREFLEGDVKLETRKINTLTVTCVLPRADATGDSKFPHALHSCREFRQRCSLRERRQLASLPAVDQDRAAEVRHAFYEESLSLLSSGLLGT